MGPTKRGASTQDELLQLNLRMKNRKEEDAKYARFHGDALLKDVSLKLPGHRELLLTQNEGKSSCQGHMGRRQARFYS